AGFALPCPDALDEAFAPEGEARRSLRAQLVLDYDLRRDAGVIGPDLPKRVVAAHAAPADQHVHQGLLECGPHVQRAGDIGGRKLDAVRGRAVALRRLEQPLLLPERVPLLLDGPRLEGLGELHEGNDGPRGHAKLVIIADAAHAPGAKRGGSATGLRL